MQEPIDVTVAAVIENGGRFLVVEEQALGRIVINQPAGHLEPGESLTDAVVRETHEETGFRFAPRSVIGIYLWHSDEAERSFLRVTFAGAASAPLSPPQLDDGILAVHWLSRPELRTRKAQLRSPMVMRCIDDFCAGARYPLTCLSHVDPRLHRTVTRGLK